MTWQLLASVFFGMAVADVLWALYFIAVAKHKKFLAAITSGLILEIGASVTIDYVSNPTLRHAASLGAAAGTLGILLISEHKERILCMGTKWISPRIMDWLKNIS